MLLGRGRFVGPLQDIKLGKAAEQSSRGLGVEIDYQSKWSSHEYLSWYSCVGFVWKDTIR